MLKTPMLKYVAGPQMFAYMPPVLGGTAIVVGMMVWILGMVADYSIIWGLVLGIGGCAASAYIGFREPHISAMLMARQKFMKKTPGLVRSKGKHYVA